MVLFKKIDTYINQLISTYNYMHTYMQHFKRLNLQKSLADQSKYSIFVRCILKMSAKINKKQQKQE